jgi:hypothetical protein
VECRRGFGPWNGKERKITLGPGLQSICIKEGVKRAGGKIIIDNKMDGNMKWLCGGQLSIGHVLTGDQRWSSSGE